MTRCAIGDLDELLKGDALIRSVLKLDPDTMDDETWAQRVNEAIFSVRFFAEAMFGKPS